MKQEYKIDRYGKEILLQDGKHQIMMEWEKPYMEACIDKLKPKGDVLEIGFGMGYSATQIQKYKPKSHTIIEMDKEVIKRLKKWAKNYDNINIIEGTWQKTLNTLGKFDEIFFDDYPLKFPERHLEERLITDRFYMFLDICAYSHTRKGSKISAYIHDIDGSFDNRIKENIYYTYEKSIFNVDIPDNCNYHKTNKSIIPLICKV